jgi:SAM-dependent methyltransferase
VHFYVEYARELGGPVLELGVGTGRVALALAREGIETVGVELVPEMLARAREKQAQLPARAREHLTVRRGDVRSVRLRRRFPLVISPFNVFMHLYTQRDLERALATVRAHLAPRGHFVFDVLMPDLHAMVRNPGRLYRGPRLKDAESGRSYEYFEAFEYDAARQVQMVSMIFQGLDRLDDLKVIPLSQRQFFPQELEMLLHYNGFRVVEHWGDFARKPLRNDSESQVIVARAR